MRGHSAAESRSRLGSVNRRQACFEDIESGMPEPRIDMLRLACLGTSAVEEGLVDVFGMLGRRIDKC